MQRLDGNNVIRLYAIRNPTFEFTANDRTHPFKGDNERAMEWRNDRACNRVRSVIRGRGRDRGTPQLFHSKQSSKQSNSSDTKCGIGEARARLLRPSQSPSLHRALLVDLVYTLACNPQADFRLPKHSVHAHRGDGTHWCELFR